LSKLTDFSLKRASVIILLILAVVAGGAYTTTRLRTELLPDITFPVLSVITIYPGASPSDVAEGVTRPLEQAMGNTAKLQTLQSTSGENLSLISASFAFGTDMKEAASTVENSLKSVVLPQNAVAARVLRFDFNSFPVVQLSLLSTDSKLTPNQLEQIARDRLVPELAKIDGVFNVEVTGGTTREVQVVFDAAKLRQKKLTAGQVSGILQANNLSFPSGTIEQNGTSVPIRTTNQFTSTAQLENLIVGVELPAGATGAGSGFGGASGAPGGAPSGSGFGGASGAPSGAPGGVSTGSGFSGSQAITGSLPISGTATGAAAFQPKPILLKDIASVVVTDSAASTIVRTNGRTAVGISVSKAREGNTVEISHKIRDTVARLAPDFANQQIKVETIQDQAPTIEESIDGLLKEGLVGALFAILVIFIFLRSVRSTLVTAISLPLSIIATLLIMGWQGLNLNIFTLGGIAIAVGRVVDDSIVVLENIYRHVQMGESPREAAFNGTKEVASAITSSTITTVAVFLPLGLVGGIIGEIFLPFALTVTYALLSSLVIALTVIPVLAMFFINARTVRHEEGDSAVQKLYAPALSLALRHRKLTLLLAVLLFFASSALVPFIPTSFLPNQGSKLATISVSPPPGGSFATLSAKTAQMEAVLADPKTQVATIQSTISTGSSSSASLQAASQGQGTTTASIQVRFKDEADLDARIRDLRATATDLSKDGSRIAVNVLTGGPPTSRLSVILSGQTQDELRQAGEQVTKTLAEVKGLANLSSDVQSARPEIAVQVDPNKAILSGQTTIQLALNIRQILAGSTATTVRLEGSGSPLNVRLLFPADTLGSEAALRSLPIGTGPTGQPVLLGDVATVSTASGPTQVTRYNQRLAATISADIIAEATGPLTLDVNKRLNALALPAGVTREVGGSFAQNSSSFNNLVLALPIAILLVYLVMVITFGSLLTPFIILFSLPLASVGAFVALFITRRPIGISALIGLLLLIGIVVTNAIVLIDRVEQLRGQGMRVSDALTQAARTRVRPILMTAVATILALLPLALGFNQGSLIAAELATVVIGGLLTSTLLTLLVVPVVYSLIEGLKQRLGGNRQPVARVQEPVQPEATAAA